MSLVKFNNGKSNALVPGIDDIFESFFNDSFLSDRMISRVPAVNICETENEYHIELAAPGLKKEDFKINLDRNMLSVSVEQKPQNAEESKKYNKREFNYTSFVRSFALPDSADNARIEAEYKDGLLSIVVAKKEEARSVSRQIEIK
ncbi:Hsp20/alpha crystallin family protein [Pararcticibacter amylolyticus]|uniref:Hsp20/alpha crystallin family protein n=1 Tax=Pararcticibacter amylolyticus TaxID=2173175 RepID=A0A2U2PB46_9SPHI|nr:Hsp20/alpha crystallin family protein [Pararcticibacter amylolyticus]PWG78617.1 Hsp20/alpha crystallin family protein [Pararcticibacter amylolyticus]